MEKGFHSLVSQLLNDGNGDGEAALTMNLLGDLCKLPLLDDALLREKRLECLLSMCGQREGGGGGGGGGIARVDEEIMAKNGFACLEIMTTDREWILFAECIHSLVQGKRPPWRALFGSERTRERVLQCVETRTGPCRRHASGVLAKLCYAAVEDRELDRAVSSFVRLLVVPLRRLFTGCASASPDNQAAVNGAMIVAGRAGAQSRDPKDQPRKPDEIALFVEEGIFDLMAPFIANPVTYTPFMNAVHGLMMSPDAVALVQPDQPLLQVLRAKRSASELAARLVDAVELLTFKKVVREKVKASGDGGKSMGEELLGVVGMANGPASLGFNFSNKEIEKEFKEHAFQQGVIKPMMTKMAEEGEEPISIENLARTVLRDHTKPVPAEEAGLIPPVIPTTAPVVAQEVSLTKRCGWPQCSVDSSAVTKRCSVCKQVFYCGAEHSRLHWPAHKATCKKV